MSKYRTIRPPLWRTSESLLLFDDERNRSREFFGHIIQDRVSPPTRAHTYRYGARQACIRPAGACAGGTHIIWGGSTQIDSRGVFEALRPKARRKSSSRITRGHCIMYRTGQSKRKTPPCGGAAMSVERSSQCLAFRSCD